MKFSPYELIESLKDSELDIDHIGRYRLCLEVSNTFLHLVAFDAKTSKCMMFERYKSFSHGNSTEELHKKLYKLLEVNRLFATPYWKSIHFIVSESPAVYVPREFINLEDPSAFSSYLALHSGATPVNSTGQFALHKGGEIVSLFYFQEALVDFLEQTYPSSSLKPVHTSGAFLEGLLSSRNCRPFQLHVLVEDRKIHVCILDIDQLKFLNTFTYQSKEDFVYFVSWVCQAHHIQPEKTELYLYGEFSFEGSLAPILKRYFSKIYLGAPPKGIIMSDKLSNIDTIRYFTLFSSALI